MFKIMCRVLICRGLMFSLRLWRLYNSNQVYIHMQGDDHLDYKRLINLGKLMLGCY